MEKTETENPDYPSKVLKSFYNSWKDSLFCDVTLKCGTKSFAAHKIVLCSLSEYFRNLFKYSTNSQQTENEVIRLESSVFKESCVKQLLNYAYTGKILIEGEFVQDLVQTANFLQIEFVQNECEKFMGQNIEISNVITVLTFATQFRLKHLFGATVSFISNNFLEIRDKGMFLDLPPEDFKQLLSDSNFSPLHYKVPIENPELELLKLVGNYLSIISVRSEHFSDTTVSELLKEIRFQEIHSNEDIRLVVDLYPVLKCLELYDALENRDNSKDDSKEIRKIADSKKILKKGRSFADGGQENTVLETFDESWKEGRESYINARPIKFTIVIRKWDGRPVVGGISVYYSNGKSVSHGGMPKNNPLFVSEHAFSLEENEVITSVTVRSGYMIDNLKFVSNLGNEFGPFGGPGGSERTECLNLHQLSPLAYLHSLSGKVVLAQGSPGITCLQFNWVVFNNTIASVLPFILPRVEGDGHGSYESDGSDESDETDWGSD